MRYGKEELFALANKVGMTFAQAETMWLFMVGREQELQLEHAKERQGDMQAWHEQIVASPRSTD